MELEVIHKPWGKEEIIFKNDHFVTKRIVINPHSRLSLQYHQYKVENIVIEKGRAAILIDDTYHDAFPGQFFLIQPGTIHRFENNTDQEMTLIECSTPELDDTVRIEDDYNRV